MNHQVNEKKVLKFEFFFKLRTVALIDSYRF